MQSRRHEDGHTPALTLGEGWDYAESHSCEQGAAEEEICHLEVIVLGSWAFSYFSQHLKIFTMPMPGSLVKTPGRSGWLGKAHIVGEMRGDGLGPVNATAHTALSLGKETKEGWAAWVRLMIPRGRG